MSAIEIRLIYVCEVGTGRCYRVYPDQKAVIRAGNIALFFVTVKNNQGTDKYVYIRAKDEEREIHYETAIIPAYSAWELSFEDIMPTKDWTITIETGIVDNPPSHSVTFTIMAERTTLTVQSEPIKGIPFSVNGAVAAWTPATLDLIIGATYTITIPEAYEDEETGRKYVFVHWEDGSTNVQRTIRLTGDMTITATFKEAYYLTIDSQPIQGVSGRIDPIGITYLTPVTAILEQGTYTVSIQSEYTDPQTGRKYIFSHWEDGSTNPTREINLTGDKTIVATYEAQPMPPKAQIVAIEIDPPRIPGNPGDQFTITAQIKNLGDLGTLYAEVEGVAETEQSFPDVPTDGEVTYVQTLRLDEKATQDLTFNLLAGHYENTSKIQDDSKPFTVEVGVILTVNSEPITGIPFTINAQTGTTPASIKLPTGTYTITMPSEWTDPDTGKRYIFSHWEDGSTNPTRTIQLTEDTTIIATYEEVVPPPPTATLTGTVKWIFGNLKGAKITLDEREATTDEAGKFTITDIPLGTYTLTATHPLCETYFTTIDLTEPKTYEITIEMKISTTIKSLTAGCVTGLILGLLLLMRR